MLRRGGVRRILTMLLVASLFSGCITPVEQEDPVESNPYPALEDRHELTWSTNGTYSLVLEPGPYQALEVQEATFEVDTSSVWETGPSSANVHLSYWLPNNTEMGVQVPVIAVISPYFSYGPQGAESGATNVVGAGRGIHLPELRSPRVCTRTGRRVRY